jgi:fumarate reductase subunit C
METRLYRKPVSRYWWLKNTRYVLFMLREFSSVFMGLFAVLYIVQLSLLATGPDLYNRYLALLETPGWIALHVAILVFALIHTITWLSFLPMVQPVRIRGKESPYPAVLLASLMAWIALSVGIGFVMLRG